MHAENGTKVGGMEEPNGKELQTFVFEEQENGVPAWFKTKRNNILKVFPCYCGKRTINRTVRYFQVII